MQNINSCALVGRRLPEILRSRPDAVAEVKGGSEYPDIYGLVKLYGTNFGTVVFACVTGLPKGTECKQRVFGFHIHEGTSCTGNASDEFADTLTHYNPHSCEHPYHAGDMPVLFANSSNALLLFMTDRFNVDEVKGKAVVIHENPDDFTTQPSGNSGRKIACGIIQ